MPMKLLVTVVDREDMYPLSDALMRAGYGATIIHTTGGFLREGNATLLVGVEEQNLEDVFRIMRAHCHARTKRVRLPLMTAELEETLSSAAVEVQVAGAVLFIMDVERFVRISPGKSPLAER